MRPFEPCELPLLPLLLWETPPAVETILAQEGVPAVRVNDSNRFTFTRGRFVLYDGRRVKRSRVREMLRPEHVTLDLDELRRREPSDPFVDLLRTDSSRAEWTVGDARVTERVAGVDRAALRERLIQRLAAAVTRAGGLWVRLATCPHPYRSAFNFRVDLDEPVPEDYHRFARMRQPLADCTTHFVNTSAYENQPDILADLRSYDSQSHAHYHVVYRDEISNRRNLQVAHEILGRAGMEPVGFAGPEGRWNLGLNRVLESLGYQYSSEFQVGYDDRPFFPWIGDRFSTVLQVPVHPICEGIFLDAGFTHPRRIADYLTSVVRAKVSQGEPAFLYGHPERRLGRMPQVLSSLADAVEIQPLLWRVTLTEFARWWRWRLDRSWSLVSRSQGALEVQFDDWDGAYPLAVEVVRGDHVAALPVTGPRMALPLAEIAYERRVVRVDAPKPVRVHPPWSLKRLVRKSLDYETTTPLHDLPGHDLRCRLKRRLRSWRDRGGTS